MNVRSVYLRVLLKYSHPNSLRSNLILQTSKTCVTKFSTSINNCTMSSENKPVIISGAGVAGLLLAQSLRKNNISFLLYERDSAGSSRSQGYRIRISAQGLGALSAVLPPNEYQDFRDGCSNNMGGKITAYNAINMEERPTSGSGAPRGGGEVLGVDRKFLRTALFKGIEENVQFNKTVVDYELTESGVKAVFSDGSKSPDGVMLVGADGVRSKVTPKLTNGKLKVYDTGSRMIHGSSPRASFAGLAQGRFGAFTLFDEKNHAGHVSMITNVRDEPGDNKAFGWVMVGSPGSFDAPNNDFSVGGKPAADISIELTRNWSDAVRPIFTEQIIEEAAFLKLSTSDPKGVPEWQNQPRVTLMGDAVHAMTPAGGVGANTALRDAEFLGSLLAKRQGWANDVTAIYEKEMRVYASQNVQDSWETIQNRIGKTRLEKTI